MQTRIESTSEGARRLDISCESTSLPGVTEPSTRPKPRLALDKPNRPKCPDGHTVDISSAKWTTPNGTYTYCRFTLDMAEIAGIPRHLATVSGAEFHAKWRIPT